ncbi:SpoIID/LytB domain-containing protein [Adonisia turfae]|uniref:SpoIID/LytB domain-containing protein n=1 Tax=Adonisia turfae TaxID=2950184 RepID=UPI002029A0A9|nr:SpoIID/LytB domain-containing protein [Adonisia turfae]
MPLKLSRIASVILSAVMISAPLTGVGRQVAKADTTASPATNEVKPKAPEDKASQTKPEQKSSATAEISPKTPKSKPSKPEQPQSSATTKTSRSSTSPAPIEPFIQADAVALGQWLVTKTVKNLVDNPADSAAKPATQPKKPDGWPSPSNRAASAAKPQPAAQPQTPTLPKVAVRALPPEPSSNPTIDNYTEMRVALTKQAPDVSIAASEGGVLVSTNGELVENVSAGISYQISADERGLFVNGQPAPTALWVEPDNGYVAVGNRWYRGRLLLLWQNGGVMAVNYVMLQEYLYSVVGAEMSASWSLEALKAQAVAARSYAIVHTVRHQRRTYDLDDTQRYQAYKGIATEASSTQQAVHETSGEFISYGGGVVESLYAANQDIVDDAHSGYGMSQTGALDLAEQGYRYYEILSAYYPDTSVGRIDIGE